MVKKGLSLEEKRAKILNIYHGTKSIFSLKEIEKAASKQGVVSQTIKVSGKWEVARKWQQQLTSLRQAGSSSLPRCVKRAACTGNGHVGPWCCISRDLSMAPFSVDRQRPDNGICRRRLARAREPRAATWRHDMSVLGTPTLALTVQ